MIILKKIGWFFMSAVPAVVCMALQMLVGLGVMMIFAIIGMVQKMGEGVTDMDILLKQFQADMMGGVGLGVVGYHIVGTFIFALWYYLYFVRKKEGKGSFRKLVPMKGLTVKSFLIALFAGIFLCIMANALVISARYIVPDIIKNYEELMHSAEFGEGGIILLAVIIFAPIGEEFLCRGLIFHYAKKVSKKFWVANIIQAFMFACIHMNLVQGTYAFLLGLALGWLYERYQTLAIPIFVHFVINFSSSVWIGAVFYFIPEGMAASFLILFISSAVCILAMWLAVVDTKKDEADKISNTYHPYQ